MSPCFQGISLISWRWLLLLPQTCFDLPPPRAYRKSLCKIFCTNEVDVYSCLKANLNELKCDALQRRLSVRFFCCFSQPFLTSLTGSPLLPIIKLVIAWESCAWTFSFHTQLIVENKVLVLSNFIQIVKKPPLKNPEKVKPLHALLKKSAILLLLMIKSQDPEIWWREKCVANSRQQH